MEKVLTNQKRSIKQSQKTSRGTRYIQSESRVYIKESSWCRSNNKDHKDNVR